jgi:hypothetical protein
MFANASAQSRNGTADLTRNGIGMGTQRQQTLETAAAV